MQSIAIGLFLVSSLHAIACCDTVPSGNEISFTLDSLEIQPLPEIYGLDFGNTTLDLHTEASTFDPSTRKVHISGRVVIKQDQEGISSCTIALGSLKMERGVLRFSPRLKILTDKEGRFLLGVRIRSDDVLLLGWTGELYRLYRIGGLVQ